MSPLLQVTLTIPRQKLSTTISLTHCDVRFLGWNFSLIINKQTTLARGENPSCSRDGGHQLQEKICVVPHWIAISLAIP